MAVVLQKKWMRHLSFAVDFHTLEKIRALSVYLITDRRRGGDLAVKK